MTNTTPTLAGAGEHPSEATLDELSRLEREATAGPWLYDLDVFDPEDDAEIEACFHDETISLLGTIPTGIASNSGGEAMTKAAESQAMKDVTLTCAARNAMPALIAAARELNRVRGSEQNECMKCGARLPKDCIKYRPPHFDESHPICEQCVAEIAGSGVLAQLAGVSNHSTHARPAAKPAWLARMEALQEASQIANKFVSEMGDEIIRMRRSNDDCGEDEDAYLNKQVAAIEIYRRICVVLECDKLPTPGAATGGASLDALIPQIHEWQLATFPHATPSSKAEHLRREVLELVADPADVSEMADVFFLLAGIASVQGVNLAEAVAAKFAKNKARKWGKPDEHGVVEHVRTGETS